jgi:hypothetical protein
MSLTKQGFIFEKKIQLRILAFKQTGLLHLVSDGKTSRLLKHALLLATSSRTGLFANFTVTDVA